MALKNRDVVPDKSSSRFRRVVLSELPREPLVSVLIANHNYDTYLPEAIESVLAQDYENLQLIICDDGSTDRSRQIIANYQSRFPGLIAIFKANGGQASALNHAYEKSRGEIICLLDSDDLFSRNKVSRIVEAFRSLPNSGFAINRMRKIGNQGERLGEIPVIDRMPHGWQGERLSCQAPSVLRGLPPCSGLSFRREIGDLIFPLPETLRAYADTMIQILAPMMTPIIAIEDSLSSYRVHGANVAGSTAFTCEQLENKAAYESTLWLRWETQVERLLSVAGAPPPLRQIPPASLWGYARARYAADSSYRELYRRATSGAWFKMMPRLHRWYWKSSILLPDFAFRRSLEFVYGQSPAKLIASRAAAALRSLKNWNRTAKVESSPHEAHSNRSTSQSFGSR